MVELSSKELLIRAVGVWDVQTYERVKAMTMRISDELTRAVIQRVGGRAGLHGEGCDAVTSLGRWEFCLQHNTKNSAGKAADERRCPDRCVQILGKSQAGWMSGGAFLELHGVDADELDAIVSATFERIAWDDQRRLPL